MFQKRLNEFVVLSIEKYLLQEIEYENLVKEFYVKILKQNFTQKG